MGNVSYTGRIARITVPILVFVTAVTLLYNVPDLNRKFLVTPAISSVAVENIDLASREKNLSSVRALLLRTKDMVLKKKTIHGDRNNTVWGRTIPTSVKMLPKKIIINVGFFEGYRKRWNYPALFQPPPSPRTCECFKENEVKFYANVTLEKNQSRTGMFEVLFFPQDVSFMHVQPLVWDTILKASPAQTQRRIYATFEGASKLRFLALSPPYNKKVFHWSLTHHSQSDFTMPYGYYSPLSPKTPTTLGLRKNWAEGRKGLVAWMSTWSVTSWRRDLFVQNLKKYISVDLFGENKGRKSCPRSSKQCEQTIRSYKFYLALENSCCSEYISEKFWRTLAWDIVPIVVGAPRESYERLAPPNSYIYADDFATMKDLAQYITKLDKNDDLYNQYFAWKEEGEVFVNYPDIQGKQTTTTVPPDNFFYSCNMVCKVSNKYLNEKWDTDIKSKKNYDYSSTKSFFDPNVSWWCGSCTKCGQHNWIRNFT